MQNHAFRFARTPSLVITLMAAFSAMSWHVARASQPQSLLSIELPDTISIGEPLPIHLRATNESQATVALGLMSTISERHRPSFDVFITDAAGGAVWHRLKPRQSPIPGYHEVVLGANKTVELRPGAHIDWWMVWDLRDDAGKAVRPGVYHVRGEIPEDRGGRLVSATQSVTVLP